jgi:hypothetical protein
LCISAVEEWLRTHDEPLGTKLSKPRERRFDLAFLAGLKNVELKSERPRCRLHLRQQRPRDARTGRVDGQSHDSRVRDQLVQEFQPLRVYSTFNDVTPVMLPPGRLRLGTSPAATGSAPVSKTIGIVVVAAFTASAPAILPAPTIVDG